MRAPDGRWPPHPRPCIHAQARACAYVRAQVYVQYSIRTADDDLLYSTRSDEGGPGEAFAFLLEKGVRVPRAWEIAVKGKPSRS